MSGWKALMLEVGLLQPPNNPPIPTRHISCHYPTWYHLPPHNWLRKPGDLTLSESDEDELIIAPPTLERRRSLYSTTSQIVGQEEIKAVRSRLVQNSAKMLKVSEGQADVLLRYVRYDMEKILICSKDPFALAELRKSSGFSLSPSIRDAKTNAVCEALCSLEPLALEATHALACGHAFCNNCWRGFLRSEIALVRVDNIRVTCPGLDAKGRCREGVDLATMALFLDDSDLQRIQELVHAHFVANWKQFRQCPGKGCTDIVRCAEGQVRLSVVFSLEIFTLMFWQTTFPQVPVQCSKGHAFCFACGERPHQPCPCLFLCRWNQVTRDAPITSWYDKLRNDKICKKFQSSLLVSLLQAD